MRNSPIIKMLSLLLLLISAAAGVSAAPQENVYPGRIVSLSPSLTETLYAIGAGDQIVGVTTYCNYPEDALSKEKVGGFSAKTISIEKILSLAPHIVFADASRHEAVAGILRKASITVVAIDTRSVEDVFETITVLSEATGHQEEGRTLASRMRDRISAVTDAVSRIPADRRLRVFWEIFDEPLMTAGPGTFTSQLVTTAGGINVFADVDEDWPQVSPEEVLKRDPQVLMCSDNHAEKVTVERLTARTGWKQLTAVKDQRIHLFNGDMVSRPGPRIVDALEAIAGALYPELFR